MATPGRSGDVLPQAERSGLPENLSARLKWPAERRSRTANLPRSRHPANGQSTDGLLLLTLRWTSETSLEASCNLPPVYPDFLLKEIAGVTYFLGKAPTTPQP